jgi:hypothetical protein
MIKNILAVVGVLALLAIIYRKYVKSKLTYSRLDTIVE